ncbi:MAG: DNA (cytosine-5-)-methyltransferase [Sphingobacteriaceae bacterium]|nr:DNA (cytosine-5-)-methyltransferase [Sphingobacteriaceae bacterium]
MTPITKVVSLFCGAGGLDLGFRNEGFEVVLAIDSEEAAIATHKRNFIETMSVRADLTEIGPLGVLELVRSKINENDRIGIIGGPPCQGFSRSNPNSNPEDPRNSLPALYVQIISELQRHYNVDFVVFENVLGMKDKKHSDKYRALVDGLSALSFSVDERELCAFDFGVPQKRYRIIISALSQSFAFQSLQVEKRKGQLSVREAIGELCEPAYFNRTLKSNEIPLHPNHWTMRPKSKRFQEENLARANKTRSFRRLSWDKASPTIAFGNREIHVHPNGKRRLSIYEAMLLQGFPNSFILEGNFSEQVTQISNAVPPPLAQSIAVAIKSIITETTITDGTKCNF